MKIISNLLIENGFEILLQKKDFAGFDAIYPRVYLTN